MKRIQSLDGLRAFSILLVLSGHASNTTGAPLWLAGTDLSRMGVLVFFVISGYLITTILLRENAETGTISLSNFYCRRAFRILPAAYAFITIVAILFRSKLDLLEICSAFLYFENFVGKHWHLGHLWSLSIEEQFYMLWPLVFAFAFRRIKTVALCVVALSPLLRVAFYYAGYIDISVYTFTVADSVATGCLLAILWNDLEPFNRWLVSTWTAVVSLFLMFSISLAYSSPIGILRKLHNSIGLSIVQISIAVLIFNAVHRKYWILNNCVMVYIGVLSYSIYLWQQPFLEPASTAWYARFPLNIVLAFCAAAASYYLVERPALRLRDRTLRNGKPDSPGGFHQFHESRNASSRHASG